MFCFMEELWDTEWKEFKVNCTELELMKFIKFLCFFDDKRYILDDGINSFNKVKSIKPVQ